MKKQVPKGRKKQVPNGRNYKTYKVILETNSLESIVIK